MDDMNMWEMSRIEIEELCLTTTYYNLSYNTSKKYQSVYDVLCVNMDSKNRKEVWSVITNTARALNSNAVGMCIPKTQEPYYNNPQGLTYRKMFAVLDRLVAEGYMLFYCGGLYNMNIEDKVKSVYMFTDKYLKLWKHIDVSSEKNDIQAVVVKDRETKHTLSNKGRKGVADKEKSVLMLNHSLESVNICVDNISVCTQQYFRAFNDNLTKGGRFYNTNGGVQTLPQHRRKEMKINGEKVVELDFKSLHPALLYEKARQKAPDVVDYWIDKMWHGEFKPYNSYSPYFSPNDQEDDVTVRRIHKFAVMVSLNARNIADATRSLSHEFFEDKKREQRKYGEISYIDGINGKPTFPSKKICQNVQDWNRPIQDFFFSDIGIILQNVDSDIMAVVIEELYQLGEVLLPVHDSIIVRESIADVAEKTMRKAYKDIMDTDVFCFIERK